MAGPRKINKGTRLSGIPADGWNGFVDTHRIVAQQRLKNNGPAVSSSAPESVNVLVLNGAGEDLTTRFPVLRLTAPVVTPADTTDAAGVALRGVQFNADKPTAETAGDFVIAQGPIADGGSVSAVIAGLTWCLIDVVDEGHEFGIAKDDDTTELESSTSGAPIIWKESGTGTKLAIVRLGAGGAAVPSGRAILFGTLEPASLVLDLDATDSSAAGVNHGDQSGEGPVVIPLVFKLGDYEAQLWGANSEGTEGEPMKLPAENHCWGTCIVGGDGQEQLDEFDVGTGVYNEPPMLVEGFTFKKIIGEGEESEEVTYYAVTDVITPLVAFVGTADDDVTGADFDATPTLGIHGLLPQGTKAIENELAWDIDEGGKVIIVKGFDATGVKYWAFNAECPA